MQIRFDGRTIAVTGAGHGFGRAIARSFAELGGRVFATDLSGEELEETAGTAGIATRVIDLADRGAARGWIAEVERQSGGAIDVLVSNAGGVAGQVAKPVGEVTDAEWDVIFAINVHAAFVLARAAAPAMQRGGRGRIITISSGAGLQPSLTGIQAYCSAKHALVGLTRQLAHELGPFGITVNSVAPGFIRTNPATERQWQSYGADGQQGLIERIALRRLGTAEDIANAVLFLASDLACFISGQVLQVDGGR